MQLTPDGIKWIFRFRSCCDKAGFQPTFKLFHQLFVLIRSNHLPLYELRLRADECGYGPGQGKLVIMQTSLKFWNGDLIFLKGLDLGYMSHIVISEEIEDFQPLTLKDNVVHHVFKFCECLGYQFTRDTFMKHNIMHTHGCKFLAL